MRTLEFPLLPLAMLWLDGTGRCEATRALEDLLLLEAPTPQRLTEHLEVLDDQGQDVPVAQLPWSRAQRGEPLDVRCVVVDRRDGRRAVFRIRSVPEGGGTLMLFEDASLDPEVLRTAGLLGNAAVSLLKARGRGSMATAIARVLAEALVAELVLVHVHRPGSGELELVGKAGIEDALVDEWLSLPMAGESLPALAAQGTQMIEADPSAPSAHRLLRELAERGVVSVVAVPLRSESALEGTLFAARAQRGALSASERRMLEAVASGAATWLDQQRQGLRPVTVDARALREAVLDKVLELCPSGVLVFTAPDGDLLALNRRAKEIFGPWVDESLLWRPRDVGLYRADGALLEATSGPLWRALHGEAVRDELLQVSRPHGPAVPIRVSAAPARLGTEPVAVVAWVDTLEAAGREVTNPKGVRPTKN